jgi:succinyl-CoA synthetase beta subunit
VIVASPKGGMDIEQVAEESPDQIFHEVIDITKGPQPEQTKRIAEKLGFTGKDVAIAQDQMSRYFFYSIF